MNGEYKFEQAIKQDEKRIACYYDNLPLFLDLPGENEAIFERIAKTSGEKVRSCSDSGELRQAPSVWSSDYDEGIDEEQAEKYFAHPAGYEILNILDDIAVCYAECFALNNDESSGREYLRVLCQCSKTLAVLTELIYTPEHEKEMRSVLGRRALHDINDLSFMFDGMKNSVHKNSGGQELELLQIVRKNILDMIFDNSGE